jgi:hypothetical protein
VSNAWPRIEQQPEKKKPGQMTRLLMFGAPEEMNLGTGKLRYYCPNWLACTNRKESWTLALLIR